MRFGLAGAAGAWTSYTVVLTIVLFGGDQRQQALEGLSVALQSRLRRALAISRAQYNTAVRLTSRSSAMSCGASDFLLFFPLYCVFVVGQSESGRVFVDGSSSSSRSKRSFTPPGPRSLKCGVCEALTNECGAKISVASLAESADLAPCGGRQTAGACRDQRTGAGTRANVKPAKPAKASGSQLACLSLALSPPPHNGIVCCQSRRRHHRQTRPRPLSFCCACLQGTDQSCLDHCCWLGCRHRHQGAPSCNKLDLFLTSDQPPLSSTLHQDNPYSCAACSTSDLPTRLS